MNIRFSCIQIWIAVMSMLRSGQTVDVTIDDACPAACMISALSGTFFAMISDIMIIVIEAVQTAVSLGMRKADTAKRWMQGPYVPPYATIFNDLMSNDATTNLPNAAGSESAVLMPQYCMFPILVTFLIKHGATIG